MVVGGNNKTRTKHVLVVHSVSANVNVKVNNPLHVHRMNIRNVCYSRSTSPTVERPSRTLTSFNIISQTDANLSLFMRRDSQPCLPVNPSLT